MFLCIPNYSKSNVGIRSFMSNCKNSECYNPELQNVTPRFQFVSHKKQKQISHNSPGGAVHQLWLLAVDEKIEKMEEK